MNKRIGQLAEQAGLLGPSSRVGNSHEATEKFVQLIVEECATVIERNLFQGIGWNTSRAVKKHFGIDNDD
jgi:hypothetical protein